MLIAWQIHDKEQQMLVANFLCEDMKSIKKSIKIIYNLLLT